MQGELGVIEAREIGRILEVEEGHAVLWPFGGELARERRLADLAGAKDRDCRKLAEEQAQVSGVLGALEHARNIHEIRHTASRFSRIKPAVWHLSLVGMMF